jgi:hypothetical protein
MTLMDPIVIRYLAATQLHWILNLLGMKMARIDIICITSNSTALCSYKSLVYSAVPSMHFISDSAGDYCAYLKLLFCSVFFSIVSSHNTEVHLQCTFPYMSLFSWFSIANWDPLLVSGQCHSLILGMHIGFYEIKAYLIRKLLKVFWL